MKQARIVISGKVQGVFFRAQAKIQARSRSLTGWVRNTENGSVEALAQGEQSDLDAFIAWCRHGPERARVEKISVEWEEPTEEFEGFRILED